MQGEVVVVVVVMEKRQTKGTHINHVLRIINDYGLKYSAYGMG